MISNANPTTVATRVPPNGQWDIESLLAEASRLRPLLAPLFSWEELRAMIDACTDLTKLRRQPEIETLYMGHFRDIVKANYGNTEAYLCSHLAWDGHNKQEGELRGREFWKRGDAVLVRRNDWPYAIPTDVEHWVVWTSAPIVHPLLCIRPLTPTPPSAHLSSESSASSISSLSPTSPFFSSPASSSSSASSSTCSSPPSPSLPSSAPTPTHLTLASSSSPTWTQVQQMGLTGFTGQPTSGPQLSGHGGGKDGPGREVEAFVRGRWGEKEWETAWFVNPPTLQSVKGLPHFHVLARRKEGY